MKPFFLLFDVVVGKDTVPSQSGRAPISPVPGFRLPIGNAAP